MKKGSRHTIESRMKLSKSLIGRSCWCKGKKLSDEHRKRLSESHLGKHLSEENKKKISDSHIGKKPYIMTDEIRLHMSLSKKGIISPMKGKHHTLEARKKMSENQQGENAHGWKGGITQENQMQRAKFQREMQKEVFERDNYTCQICGAKQDLQVDHIQKWSEYVELRFDMDNCRTVCAKCHYKITFGREMSDSVKTWGHNFITRKNMEN